MICMENDANVGIQVLLRDPDLSCLWSAAYYRGTGFLVLELYSRVPSTGMTHIAEEGNRRKGGMTNAEMKQSVLGAYRFSFISFSLPVHRQ